LSDDSKENHMEHRLDKRRMVGWLAVGLSAVISCFWAMWGIIENFHEGWYYNSLPANLGLMLAQYLSPMLIFVGLALFSIRFPHVGGAAHALLGLLVPLLIFKSTNVTVVVLITLPLVLLGAAYWYGRPRARKVGALLIAGLSAVTLIVCGVVPAVRVAGRVDDRNHEARLVNGNGVNLVWAPEGAGWSGGASWQEAMRRCQCLDEDGRTLKEQPQNVWHLPTVEETVRSMARHGANSSGKWDAQSRTASYRITPDKESPLWDTHSQVIYWWTGTEVDNENAYILVYDGKVWPRRKQFHLAYLGYRCVKPLA
jgi:hypothetical protein